MNLFFDIVRRNEILMNNFGISVQDLNHNHNPNFNINSNRQLINITSRRMDIINTLNRRTQNFGIILLIFIFFFCIILPIIFLIFRTIHANTDIY